MNVERMNKVADVIQANPEHFDMALFCNDPLNACALPETSDLFACGTTACIGGWAAYLWAAEVQPNDLTSEAACRILGLTKAQGADLFYAIDECSTADKAAVHLRRMALDYERDQELT